MITNFNHAVQISVFVKTLGFGYLMGFLYFTLKLLNISSKKNSALDFIKDVLFLIFWSVLSFMFSLKYIAGLFRFYVICGELIGFILFYIFPGGVYLSLSDKLKKTITNLFQPIKIKFEKQKNIALSKIKAHKKTNKKQKTHKNNKKFFKRQKNI